MQFFNGSHAKCMPTARNSISTRVCEADKQVCRNMLEGTKVPKNSRENIVVLAAAAANSEKSTEKKLKRERKVNKLAGIEMITN